MKSLLTEKYGILAITIVYTEYFLINGAWKYYTKSSSHLQNRKCICLLLERRRNYDSCILERLYLYNLVSSWSWNAIVLSADLNLSPISNFDRHQGNNNQNIVYQWIEYQYSESYLFYRFDNAWTIKLHIVYFRFTKHHDIMCGYYHGHCYPMACYPRYAYGCYPYACYPRFAYHPYAYCCW